MRRMRWRVIIGTAAVLALGGAICPFGPTTRAQVTPPPATTVPASRPATGPTTAPADLTTPKGALRAFATALHDGDARELRRAVATTNKSEDRMLVAMADWAAALLRLHDVTAKAFGDDGAARFTGDNDAQYAQSLARIDAADVAVAGDKAAVRYPGEAEPQYELARVGGEWKVPMAQFSHGADAAALDRRIVESRAQTQIILELVGEIEAGKYRTAESASDAWRGKIMQALGLRTPTTGAATKPGA